MSINWVIETFDTLPSTMDVARDRGESGSAEGAVVVAKDQTQGQGRLGNTWQNKPGNLYFSLILRSIVLKDIGQYSFIAAVALADVVTPRLKPEHVYKHKWPNDGLVDNQKFAGILLHTGQTRETNETFLNLGVGINITSAPEGKTAFNMVASEEVTAPEFLQLYLQSLERNVQIYRKRGFPEIRAKWLKNARGLNEPMKARLPNGTFEGIFGGLDESGALLLMLDNGEQKVIHSGEVYFGNEI